MASIERQAIRTSLGGDSPHEFNVLADLLAQRFSCRAFRPDPLPRAMISQMLTLAQMSPSWANTQPWNVIVTSGAATERLREALIADFESPEPLAPSDVPFPEFYPPAELARRREVGWQLYESAGIAKGDREASARQARENERLFGAPHALLLHAKRAMGPYGAIDCGLYLGNVLLAAEALGIGMIAQAALAQHCGVIRDLFGIPEDDVFIFGASFGWPDADSPLNGFRSRRAPLEESVTFIDEI